MRVRRLTVVALAGAALVAMLWLNTAVQHTRGQTGGGGVLPSAMRQQWEQQQHREHSNDNATRPPSAGQAHAATTTTNTPPQTPPPASVHLHPGPRNLRVCTLVRNMVRYIHEWIAFHRLQGFDRFVLYDDRSTDGLQEVLQPYIDTGVVELYKLDELTPETLPYMDQPYGQDLAAGIRNCQLDRRNHGHSMMYCQLAVFNDCFARSMMAGDRWTAVFDVDEFMFRPLVNGQSPGTLWEYLDSKPPDMSMMMIKGVVFGPAFEFSNWTGPVTTTHTVRPPIDPKTHEFEVPEDAKDWKLCVPAYCSDGTVELPILGKSEKAFHRTSCLKIGGAGVHFSHTTCGVWWHWWGRPDSDVRLHHYQTLSKQEALEKKEINQNEKYTFYGDDRVLAWLNAVEDSSAADYYRWIEPCLRRTIDNMFDAECALPPV